MSGRYNNEGTMGVEITDMDEHQVKSEPQGVQLLVRMVLTRRVRRLGATILLVLVSLVLVAMILPKQKPLSRSLGATNQGLLVTTVQNATVQNIAFTLLDGVLYARRTDTNTVLWQDSLGKGGWGIPIVQTSIYVNLNDGSVEALHARDGTFLWHMSTEGFASSILRVEGGLVFVRLAEPRSREGFVEALQADTGRLLWKSQTTSFAHLYVGSQSMYLVDQGSRLRAFRVRDGSLLWHVQVQGEIGCLAPSSGQLVVTLVGGNRHVFLRSIDGQLLYVLRRYRRAW